jgi:molybdate transport system permease protein
VPHQLDGDFDCATRLATLLGILSLLLFLLLRRAGSLD